MPPTAISGASWVCSPEAGIRTVSLGTQRCRQALWGTRAGFSAFLLSWPGLTEKASRDGPRTLQGEAASVGGLGEGGQCGRSVRWWDQVPTPCCPLRAVTECSWEACRLSVSLCVVLSSPLKLLRRPQSSPPAPPHPLGAARAPSPRRRQLLPRACSDSSGEMRPWRTWGPKG